MEITRANYFEKSQSIFTQVTDQELTRLLIENGMFEKDFDYEGQLFVFDFHSYSQRYDARSIYYVSELDGKQMLFRVSDHWSCELSPNDSSTQTKICSYIRRCFWAITVTQSSNRAAIAGVCSFEDMTLHTANGNFVNSCRTALSCI